MSGFLDPRRRSPRVLFAVVHLVTSAALGAVFFFAVVLALGPHPVASKPAPVEPFVVFGLVALMLVALRILFEARRLGDLGVHPAWCLAAKLPVVIMLAIVLIPALREATDGAVATMTGMLVQAIETAGFLALALIPGNSGANAAGTPPPSPWKLGARAPSPV